MAAWSGSSGSADPVKAKRGGDRQPARQRPQDRHGDRRQRADRARRRRQAGDRRSARRHVAATKKGGRRRASRNRRARRDGRRRRQRRAGARRGRCRHRHGQGFEVAVESAGITLVKGDLNGIVRARRLAQATIATSGRTCSSPLYTMRLACRSRRAFSIRCSGRCCRRCCRGGDEPVFRIGDRQCAEAADIEVMRRST